MTRQHKKASGNWCTAQNLEGENARVPGRRRRRRVRDEDETEGESDDDMADL